MTSLADVKIEMRQNPLSFCQYGHDAVAMEHAWIKHRSIDTSIPRCGEVIDSDILKMQIGQAAIHLCAVHIAQIAEGEGELEEFIVWYCQYFEMRMREMFELSRHPSDLVDVPFNKDNVLRLTGKLHGKL